MKNKNDEEYIKIATTSGTPLFSADKTISNLSEYVLVYYRQKDEPGSLQLLFHYEHKFAEMVKKDLAGVEKKDVAHFLQIRYDYYDNLCKDFQKTDQTSPSAWMTQSERDATESVAKDLLGVRTLANQGEGK